MSEVDAVIAEVAAVLAKHRVCFPLNPDALVTRWSCGVERLPIARRLVDHQARMLAADSLLTGGAS